MKDLLSQECRWAFIGEILKRKLVISYKVSGTKTDRFRERGRENLWNLRNQIFALLVNVVVANLAMVHIRCAIVI